jgi:hypothetical protein
MEEDVDDGTVEVVEELPRGVVVVVVVVVNPATTELSNLRSSSPDVFLA